VRTVYWGWSMLLTAAIVVQIGLAGYGAFYAANKLDDEGSTIDDDVFMDGFGFHAGFGYLVILLGLIFMVIGIAAGIGKWRLGRHGLLFLLLFVQLWLAWIGFEVPFPVGFLHPINAMLILALSAWISWDEWQRRKTVGAAPSAAT
jgi:hypothetical protein